MAGRYGTHARRKRLFTAAMCAQLFVMGSIYAMPLWVVAFKAHFDISQVSGARDKIEEDVDDDGGGGVMIMIMIIMMMMMMMIMTAMMMMMMRRTASRK